MTRTSLRLLFATSSASLLAFVACSGGDGGSSPATSDGGSPTFDGGALDSGSKDSGPKDPTCTDGVKNASETDIDCGGNTCGVCSAGKACTKASDCATSLLCVGNICMAPSCTDGVQNEGETDIDCGGPSCAACSDTKKCTSAVDCKSGVCKGGTVADGGADAGGGVDGGAGGVCGPAVTLASIAPKAGVTAGGTNVTLTGTNFDSATTFSIGGVSVTGLSIVSATQATGLSPASVKFGEYDVVASAYGKNAKLTKGFRYFLSNVTYGAPTNLTFGARAYDILFGDFNGDKKLDMYVPAESSGAKLFLGAGDGTFDAGTLLTTGMNAAGFSKAEDFNGDGKLDLVIASGTFSSSDAKVSVLIGKGDGTFEAPVAYAIPTSTEGIAVGDFNGDKKLDVIAGTTNGNLFVLTGNGDGTFTVGTAIASGGAVARDIFVADFDGDNKLDVAVTAYTSTGVRVLLGKGDGTFAAPVAYGTGSYFKGDVGDVNKDGKPDLVVGNVGGNVHIFLNNGDGTFAAATTFTCGSLVPDAKLYDVDLDGKKDLVCSDYTGGNIDVGLGKDDGTFATALSFPAATSAVTTAIGDLNGDGIPDFAEVHETATISVLLGTGN